MQQPPLLSGKKPVFCCAGGRIVGYPLILQPCRFSNGAVNSVALLAVPGGDLIARLPDKGDSRAGFDGNMKAAVLKLAGNQLRGLFRPVSMRNVGLKL